MSEDLQISGVDLVPNQTHDTRADMLNEMSHIFENATQHNYE